MFSCVDLIAIGIITLQSFCNYSLHVELAHIKTVSDFAVTSTLGEVNDPSNLLVLCRNCHWEYDHGYLKIENIPNR